MAVFISMVLLMLVLFVYSSYAKMTHAQGAQSNMQQQLMFARRLIEKDVRMSGLNLPGNGLLRLNYGSAQLKLVFLRNENNKNTGLMIDAHIGDSLLMVKDAHGVSVKQWVCLARDSSVVYYQIARIGLSGAPGCDTLKLADSTVSAVWNKSVTQVRFAKGIFYDLTHASPTWCLMRHASDGDQAIGSSIDSISYTPKDSSGVSTGNNFARAKIIEITLAGRSPDSPVNFRVIKTFEAMIRN
jgi:hypothetical protein